MTEGYLNFSIRSLEQILIKGGYQIVITTDIPCHLWLRWTNLEPWTHLRTEIVRGLPILKDPYYCFDVYWDIEQVEAGDTYYHTFIWEGWEVCYTHWFYFHGNIDTKAVVSTSCLFKKHYPDIIGEQPTEFEHYYNASDSMGGLLGDNIEAQSFDPQFNQLLTHINIKLKVNKPYAPDGDIYIVLELVEDFEGEPTGTVLAAKARGFKAPVGWSDYGWQRFILAATPLTAFTPYWIRVRQIPRGFIEQSGWWLETNANPYPRGYHMTSLNWGGTWGLDPNNCDAFFATHGYPLLGGSP